MRWFRRWRGRPAPIDAHPGASPGTVTVRCATCGRALGRDPEDEPDGDAGLPICGECDRARDFDALDLADGDMDGELRS